ncbi:winged helix-turn-helix domain-containing protein [Ktedonobacter racemifer]|uniref:winged helix-turn-helix domain-containing protein n=1 Tax=Ktedonobacter racemifer TaxID=363277 RepID=UPI001FCBC09E|nr:winged helix-turn-helix domain-containing protein [Ktedonobacter racemifer]
MRTPWARLLQEAGWSVQQPIERATQRNEEAIRTWYEERWPAIKKTRIVNRSWRKE